LTTNQSAIAAEYRSGWRKREHDDDERGDDRA
jgi:hypothetical protein